MSARGTAVLVTTEFRGVFFGYIQDRTQLPEQVTLMNARNCIYWSADIGGFLGLAAIGPSDACRIGKQIAELTLYKITSVSSVTEAAVKNWENA